MKNARPLLLFAVLLTVTGSSLARPRQTAPIINAAPKITDSALRDAYQAAYQELMTDNNLRQLQRINRYITTDTYLNDTAALKRALGRKPEKRAVRVFLRFARRRMSD